MLKLCPIKYGVKLVPSSGMWLVSSASGLYVADFDGAAWTNVLSELAITGHLYTTGDYAYFKKGGTGALRYAALSDLTTWTSLGTVSASATTGQMDSDGTYLYSSSGGQSLVRASLPIGSASNYGASNVAEGILCNDGAIYGVTGNIITKSTDSGLTFSTLSSTYIGTNSPLGSPAIATNGTGRIVVFATHTGGLLVSKYTDDDFATLSSDTIAEAVTSQTTAYRSLIWDGSHFVGVLRNGSCYRSTDGAAWTKTTIPSSTVNSIGHGGGRLMVVDASGQIFSSDDHGATWDAFPATGVGEAYSDIIYLPIGI